MFAISLLGLTLALSIPQNASPNESEKDFDFWIGEWNVEGRSRTAPGKDEWTKTVGSNSIKKTLNGSVIEENFSMPGFTGRSWTSYRAPRKLWAQTWVDDQKGYLTFEGGKVGETVVLSLLMPVPNQPKMQMVFSDITKDKFIWRWQRQAVGSKDWETQWELTYSRKG